MLKPRSGEMFIEPERRNVCSSVGAEHSIARKRAEIHLVVGYYKHPVPNGTKTRKFLKISATASLDEPSLTVGLLTRELLKLRNAISPRHPSISLSIIVSAAPCDVVAQSKECPRR